MLRRFSALFTTFLMAGLATWTGLAGASTGQGTQPAPTVEPAPTIEPAAAAALLELHAAPAAQAPGPNYPQRIESRLEQLATRSPARVVGPTRRRLRVAVEAALGSIAGRAAIEIRDLQSGAVLASHQGERALNPASNQKLVTAIAAVELLGPDYRFETSVWRAGDALILRGEGDPDLHLHDLHALAEATAREGALAGIETIIVDDGAFDEQSLGPGFRSDGPGDSYVAPSGALAIDYATVEVSVRPGRRHHGPAEVSLSTPGAAIEVHNEATTKAGRLEVTTRRGESGQTIVEVSGGIPGGHAPVVVRRRVTDPGLVAATAFAELLAHHQDGAPLPVRRGDTPRSATLVATHRSSPLVSVLASALRYSNNFTAEQVLRTLAWRATGRPGSWADGVAVLDRFARALSPERADAQRFVNGSGLSLDGRLSPSFIVDVLALSTEPSSSTGLLLASFAKAGSAGTLRNRMPGAGARVVAKTGTYAGASSLSGIVRDREGEGALAFSILINGGELEASRAMQDRLVGAML